MSEILELVLGRYLYKEDIQALCEELDLPVSGSKDDLIARVLDDDEFDPGDALAYLSKEELKDLCDELEIPVGGTRDELLVRILEQIVDEEDATESVEPTKGAEPTRSSTPKISRSRAPSQPADYDGILSDIKRWVPKMRHPTENGYQLDLQAFLEYECGYQTRLEGGETEADILIAGRFPIELKKNPTQEGYDRFLGQLTRHERAHGFAIGVVCDVKRRELFQDFLVNLERSAGEKHIQVIEN